MGKNKGEKVKKDPFEDEDEDEDELYGAGYHHGS
jgi:hypothetical protein